MRKFLALLLIVVGVGIVWLNWPDTGSDPVAIARQHSEVVKIEKGMSIKHKCNTGALMKVRGWKTLPIVNGATEHNLNLGLVTHFYHTGPLGVGNYALAGHVVTHGEPFAKLPQLRNGDKVEIDRCDKRYIFTVNDKFDVYYTNLSVLKDKPKTLTLITCASRYFHTDYRTVVTARLTTVV